MSFQIFELGQDGQFGDVAGHCGNYTITPAATGCRAAAGRARAVAERLCVGRRRCVVDASRALFGPLTPATCASPGGVPRLAVQARCSNATKRHTYWNFTLPDQMMLDYWRAVDGEARPQIPNFSTPPSWLYSNTTWAYNGPCTGDGPDHCTYGGYEQGPAPASARGGVDALGDYYGRLLAWYTRGGFHDEYGDWVGPGHRLNITLWEVFNEVIAEHQHTPESYTREFDAIVAGIRRFADPDKRIKFVGMNLANIRGADEVLEWAGYFLNASNHARAGRDALDYIAYHAYPTSRPVGPAKGCHDVVTADDFSQFFCYADAFLEKVAAVQALVDRLSPATKTVLDECGTTRQGPFGIDQPAYWVSSGAYFAYLWARGAVQMGDRLPVVGQSQFMDSPDREPGVSMLDWRNGNGTAKYWVTRLLIESFAPGRDRFAATASNDTAQLYAQAFVGGTTMKRLLLINKRNAAASVALSGVTCCTVRVVDSLTNEGPPRAEHCGASGTLTLAAYATAVVEVC